MMNDWDVLVEAWHRMFGKRDLVTKDEAAQFLSWSTRTIDRRIDAGLIRPIFIRGSGKFRKAGPKIRESIREWEVRIPKQEVLKQFILMEEMGGERRARRCAEVRALQQGA